CRRSRVILDRSKEGRRSPPRGPRRVVTSFAELAGREVAAVDRLRQELRLVVGPELADIGIGLDHRIPELRLAVAKHLLLLDLLDVDVLDRAAGGEIELHRTADGIELDAGHGL